MGLYLSWTAVPGTGSYNIYRGMTAGGETLYATGISRYAASGGVSPHVLGRTRGLTPSTRRPCNRLAPSHYEPALAAKQLTFRDAASLEQVEQILGFTKARRLAQTPSIRVRRAAGEVFPLG